MKGFYDVNIAYSEVKKAFPGEVAVFCCDLGDSWLFRFVPKEEKDNPKYMNGYFGTAVNKETGKVSQYNMMKNMKMLSKKINLAKKLTD